MVFSDPTEVQDGIIQEIDAICGSTNNTYPLKRKTRRVNAGLDSFYAIAFEADENWQIDDLNQTDLPIAYADIDDGVNSYSFADELLIVDQVYAKDSQGNFQELENISDEDGRGDNIWLTPTGNDGSPQRYAILGNSILLDPVPNYASVEGLKVIFRRTATRFVSTDTDKVPGIPSIFHMYLARMAALPFLVEKKLAQRKDIAALITVDEERIKDFMSNRNRATAVKLRPAYRNPR